MWATGEYIVPPARKGRFLPPYKTLTARARVCMCVRSSLNTNKAPLTYCQLSEVNLSRINFRCKRLRPENPLVSNYLRIDRAMRRWCDECRLYLYLPLTLPLFIPILLCLSICLLHTAYTIFLSHSISIYFYTLFQLHLFHLNFVYTRTCTYLPFNLLHGVTIIITRFGVYKHISGV